MNPPAGIDMSVIRQALMRRMQGGGGTPATQQVSNPAGPTPLQPAQPLQPTGPLPLPQGGQAPAGAQSSPQAPQQSQGAQDGQGFDDGTKTISKALIARLLKVL